MQSKRLAVIIPFYNEEPTIKQVVTKFQAILPEAKIYVFNNNSTDKKGKIAKASGASVVKEKRQGKGFVVQSMFKKVDADVYIMVDGDDTYDISIVRFCRHIGIFGDEIHNARPACHFCLRSNDLVAYHFCNRHHIGVYQQEI